MNENDTTTATYKAVKQAAIAAEEAFKMIALDEMERLMPEGVSALIFYINDTPRLSFEGFLVDGDEPGEEREAEEIDDYAGSDFLYDTLDGIAMELGFLDFEDADNWMMRLDPEAFESRFVITRTVAAQ